MKRIKNFVCYTGIWILPVMIIVFVITKREMDPSYHLSLAQLGQISIISAVLMLFNTGKNSIALMNGKENFGPFDALFDDIGPGDDRRKAMYPPVPEALLRKEPCGIVLGKEREKYVCNDLCVGGSHNTIVVGETGCGKTSTVVLDTILCNHESDTAILAVDVKGELISKGTKTGNARILRIAPGDSESCGYDPFGPLKYTYSEQELTDTVSTIAYSLIPINAESKNSFWENSARDLLTACFVYYLRQGIQNVPDIADEIAAAPIESVIEEIMAESDPSSVERKLVTCFAGMASETLSGINAQAMDALSVFIKDESIRYMLRDNPERITAKELDRGKSIYICIPEHKLNTYARLLHLILNQTFSSLEQRPEGSGKVLIIVDELARILSAGKIDKLENALETLRSRECSLMLITQSTDALERAYRKSEVEALLQNCPYKVILSSTAKGTTDNVIRWAGKYRSRRVSQTKGRSTGTNVSYEDRDRVQASDMLDLPQKDEAIIITPQGYFRIKKTPYYSDKRISVIAREVTEHNARYNKIKKEVKQKISNTTESGCCK